MGARCLDFPSEQSRRGNEEYISRNEMVEFFNRILIFVYQFLVDSSRSLTPSPPFLPLSFCTLFVFPTLSFEWSVFDLFRFVPYFR